MPFATVMISALMPLCWWAKKRPLRRTAFAQGVHELVRRQLYAAHALYAFDDHRADISLGELGPHGLHVVQGKVGHVPAIVHRSDDLGIVGRLHRQRGTPVEGLPEGDDARAPVMERGQLQGILVGLGAAVDEEQGVVVVAACLSQARGQFLL